MADVAQTLKATLDNGLTVLIREVHRAPVASFWVWYRVGGRNEVPGITGISHWVEHMVFKGTPTYQPGEIFREVNKHGGTLNGFTWIDYTAYFETLPAPQILLGADIESDRMQNAVFDPSEVESERTVILSEREGNENQPTFHLREEVIGAAFRAHPYGQGVIGFTSDLRQITRDDLYRHYRTYYTPNNATVVVVGDVDAEAILAEIERRFGAIPSGPEPPPVRTVEPPQSGERRVVVRRPAPTATMLMAFHAPRAEDPDALPMVVLDTVLSGGKAMGYGGGGGMGRSSRLYRALVASGLCSAAGSSFSLTIDPYLFSVSATLVPSTEPARVEAIVQEELARLREEPVPEDELARAIKQLRAQFAYAGESVSSQAYWLGSLHTVAPGVDPDTFVDRLAAVTPDDLLRVARTYVTPDRATVGWLEPTAPAPAVPAADIGPLPVRPHFFSDAPGGRPDSLPAPKLDIQERTLDSGLRLLGHHDPTSDAAVLELRLPAGAIADGETPGLARFTAQMLPRGTSHRSFAELNEELDSLGAALSVSPGRDYVDIRATCLKEDVGRLAELLAEVVREPTFPEAEIDRMREQSLTALRQMLNDTRAQAAYTLRATLYPEGHPYHHRAIGTEETLTGMSRDQLADFHRRLYRPNRAILAVAGGVPVEAALEHVARAFEGWEPSDAAPAPEIAPVDPPPSRVRREEQIAGKSQADIALGLPALAWKDPDYHALRVANVILGRLGLMGRLGARVRERQGMAYYVYSTLEASLGRGLWAAYAGVNPVNVERAVESIIAEVERLREELVEDEELADAKSYLIGSLPLGLESSGAIASIMLDIAFYGFELDYVEQLPGRLNALTREQIRDAAARYLLPDRMAVVVVSPESET